VNEKILLVDYENVGRIDLSAIPGGVRVPFFFGASQKSVPTDFLKAALKLGDRFLPIDIEGQGKNALDFHIAFYLGEMLAATPKAMCVILSKDKGFDPLVKHLVGRGFHVRRVPTLDSAFPSSPQATASAVRGPKSPPPSDAYTETVRWLAAMPKKNRPRKRKGLVAHIYSHHAKKVPESQIEAFIDQLVAEGKIDAAGGLIAYKLN
jgi:hypothetical protein